MSEVGGGSLSVLVLCWNHSDYIDQCIRSLAAQTHQDFEIVFLDNASSDGSFDMADHLFRDAGLRARMLRNPEPRGIAANLNQLLAASSGDLVAPLATDDWYEPDYVAAMIKAAQDHSASGWFATNGWVFEQENGATVPVDDRQFRSGDVLKDLLNGEKPFFFVGCCYRRDALLRVGGWDEAQLIEDFDLFVRLAKRYPVTVLPRRLVHYRRSTEAISSNVQWMIDGWERFYRKHRDSLGQDPEAWMAETYRTYAAGAIDRGSLSLGCRLMMRSLRLKPFLPSSYRTLAYLGRRVLKRARKT